MESRVSRQVEFAWRLTCLQQPFCSVVFSASSLCNFPFAQDHGDNPQNALLQEILPVVEPNGAVRGRIVDLASEEGGVLLHQHLHGAHPLKIGEGEGEGEEAEEEDAVLGRHLHQIRILRHQPES